MDTDRLALGGTEVSPHHYINGVRVASAQRF